jgi:hypothetical protein
MALAGSKNWPPSEKESGVTLRMPMTSGRPSLSSADSASGPAVCTVAGIAVSLSVVLRANAMRLASRGRPRTVKPGGNEGAV